MPKNEESGRANSPENESETPGDQCKGMADIILRSAKGIFQRNRGLMLKTNNRKNRRLLF
jgi:hypothetical protein